MRPVTKISFFGVRLAVIVLAAYWIAIFTGTHLPDVLDFSPRVNDKAKHFTAFFGLAFLMCYVTNSANFLKRFGTIASVCMLYAAVDEITQGFVRGRQPDVYDFVADSIGVWIAIGCYAGDKVHWNGSPRRDLGELKRGSM